MASPNNDDVTSFVIQLSRSLGVTVPTTLFLSDSLVVDVSSLLLLLLSTTTTMTSRSVPDGRIVSLLQPLTLSTKPLLVMARGRVSFTASRPLPLASGSISTVLLLTQIDLDATKSLAGWLADVGRTTIGLGCQLVHRPSTVESAARR